jgi:hypothetical protein
VRTVGVQGLAPEAVLGAQGPGVSGVWLDRLKDEAGWFWGLCNFQELFGQSFTEMKSLTSLPVFISETDLAPLSTTGRRHLFEACTIPRSAGRTVPAGLLRRSQ